MDTSAKLIHLIPLFGVENETRHSSRYRIRNDERGDEHFVILQWTHEGSGRVEYAGQIHVAEPDTVFVLLVPEPSTYYYPPESSCPWRFSWLNVYGDLAFVLAHNLRRLHGPVIPLQPTGPAALALSHLIRSAVKRIIPDPLDHSAATYDFFLNWSRELDREAEHHRDFVEMAEEICRTRFREPLGVKEIAHAVGVTREHLTREFVRRRQTSPAHYLRSLRVQAARRMLQQPGMTQGEAALRCGFPSPKAMNRAFRENGN